MSKMTLIPAKTVDKLKQTLLARIRNETVENTERFWSEWIESVLQNMCGASNVAAWRGMDVRLRGEARTNIRLQSVSTNAIIGVTVRKGDIFPHTIMLADDEWKDAVGVSQAHTNRFVSRIKATNDFCSQISTVEELIHYWPKGRWIWGPIVPQMNGGALPAMANGCLLRMRATAKKIELDEKEESQG